MTFNSTKLHAKHCTDRINGFSKQLHQIAIIFSHFKDEERLRKADNFFHNQT